VTAFCDEHHIPRSLAARVRRFYRHKAAAAARKIDVALLDDLDAGLKAEVEAIVAEGIAAMAASETTTPGVAAAGAAV
jgi:hypothetical protein